MQEVKNSDAFWKGYDTEEKWTNFMQHDFEHPSRKKAYDIINGLCTSVENPAEFAEIGFGGCYDFEHFFKFLSDDGKISYTGIDHTKEFVEYARQKFPSYNFRQGEFESLGSLTFDITYTRHTLQHAAPEVYQNWLRAMLNATRKTAVIVWRFPPTIEHIVWNDGWNNRWDKDVVAAIIKGRGFTIEEVPVNEEDCVYILRRI